MNSGDDVLMSSVVEVAGAAGEAWSAIQFVEPEKLQTDEPFRSLFPADEARVAAIAESMRLSGYDVAQPVVAWGSKVVDGNNRMLAAVRAGLPKVPVAYMSFESEFAALNYAIARQRDRRNLSDKDVFHLVERLDGYHKCGGDRRGETAEGVGAGDEVERSSKVTARRVGVKARTVERVRQILASGNADIIAAARAGKTTIAKAALEVGQGTGKQPKAAKLKDHAVKQLSKVADDLKAHDAMFKGVRARLAKVVAEMKAMEFETREALVRGK
jgi:ParB-like chromosome segregation protein Spo0J